MFLTHHEVVSATSGSDGSAFCVHAADHVDKVDVGILLAMAHVAERSLSTIILVLASI
jgi:hypothetical protein